MVIGPAEIVKDTFDIVIVDESRLRRRVNLGAYFRAFDVVTKIKIRQTYLQWIRWIMKQSEGVYFMMKTIH
jgi:hypothetical protein